MTICFGFGPNDEPVWRGGRARFDHVLVDEYQDTNKLQARILLAMKPDGRGVTVLGDDAQSIYSFRAADVRNILEFPKAFTPEARLVTLEQNYRSTSPILEASNAVIDLASARFTKNLRTTRAGGVAPKLVSVRDEAAQASYIAESVLEARERGLTMMQQAILFRAADFSAPVELELAKRDIPFVKFGGLKFLEASHVRISSRSCVGRRMAIDRGLSCSYAWSWAGEGVADVGRGHGQARSRAQHCAAGGCERGVGCAEAVLGDLQGATWPPILISRRVGTRR
jgi:hypothetical protein